MTVVATVPDAEQLLEAVDRHRPDVALVDIRMPPSFTNEGLVAAERIRAACAEPVSGSTTSVGDTIASRVRN